MRGLILALMVFGNAYAGSAQNETLRPVFQPAEAHSITDIHPYNRCFQKGTVVLNVVIDGTGKVQEVEVRRDFPCLTQVAVQAVKDWEFSPATLAGKPITSRMPVAIIFEDQAVAPGPIPLPKLVPQTAQAVQAEFQAAQVTRAWFPPPHAGYSYAQGAVVLEVTLSAEGEADKIEVLRDLPPFTAPAQAAVGDWRFTPATFNGRPVRSKILLAFVTPPLYIP